MKQLSFTSLLLLAVHFSFAQNKDKAKDKKSVKEVINEIPDMLIAQRDAGPDSNANKLIDDNLSIVINPMWREKGTQSIIEFKVAKTDKDPLVNTFPLPQKKIAQALTINMGPAKKGAAEKKQAVIAQVKGHIAAYYKEAQLAINAQELTDKANAMIISTEPFTTSQGREGELTFINDIQTNQSGLIALLLVPGTTPASTYFVQFNYIRYTYETALPEDPMELKMFVYPDEQQAYMDFTKGIFKTFRIQ
jgi:hypothetical protein